MAKSSGAFELLVFNLWPGSALLPSEEAAQELCGEGVEGGAVSKQGSSEENTENCSLTQVGLVLIYGRQSRIFFKTLIVNLWRVWVLDT